LHNKPKAEVHTGQKLTGPKEEEEEEEEEEVRRQCCHNKHKKFPYRPTRDVFLLS
jgi:hypothetical protein